MLNCQVPHSELLLFNQELSLQLENAVAETSIIVIDGCDSLLYCEFRELGGSPVGITIVKSEVVTTRQEFDKKIRGTVVGF